MKVLSVGSVRKHRKVITPLSTVLLSLLHLPVMSESVTITSSGDGYTITDEYGFQVDHSNITLNPDFIAELEKIQEALDITCSNGVIYKPGPSPHHIIDPPGPDPIWMEKQYLTK